MWPFKRKSVRENVPLRGLRWGGLQLDAPPVHAPPEQWLDWAALLGCWSGVGNGFLCGAEKWMGQIFRAYREKWSPDGKP